MKKSENPSLVSAHHYPPFSTLFSPLPPFLTVTTPTKEVFLSLADTSWLGYGVTPTSPTTTSRVLETRI
jgi:hypothetical protein